MAIFTRIENGKKLFEVYVNGFDSAGRRIQRRKRRVDSLRKAEVIEFDFKRELAALKDAKAMYRWGEWFKECMRRMSLEAQRSTIRNYETTVGKWVTPHWVDREMDQITKSDVYEMIFTQCADIKTSMTRFAILKRVKRIFQMAVEDGLLSRNPCVGIKVRVGEVVQEVLTPAEVDIFLREAKRCHHRFYPVWVVALMTGMRSGEMYALRWTDLDFEGRTISVSRAWNSKCGFTSTKTRRSRVVPMSEDLVKFLRERKLKHGTETEFVLPRLSEWTTGEQARVTREFCDGLNINSVKFHDLRATFITNLLSRGESLARVMSIVGHSEIRTTNGYLRRAGVDVQGGTDKLSYKLPQDTNGRVLSLVKGED